ncbi:MAG: cyclic nucleotide-binding domain-containing protein [Nitrospirota bacterium]
MEDNLEILRSIPIFAGIKDEALHSLVSVLKEERFLKGEYIIREGDYTNTMYILRSGEVEVRKVINRESNRYKTLAILEEGDIFGEMAVFGEEFRTADVITREDSILWKMDYSDLSNIIEADPVSGVRLLQVIITILIARIKSLNRELATLYEIGRLIPETKDLEGLTGVVFGQVMNDIEPAKMGLIAIWNKFNDEFDIHHSLNMSKEHTIERNDPISIWLLENRSPLLIKDTVRNPEFEGRFYSGRSFIASPFIHDSEVLGFILLSNPYRKNAFTYSHLVLLSAVCNQVGARMKDIEKKTEDVCKERLAQVRL